MFHNNTVCNRFNKGCKCKQQKTKNSVSDFYAVSVMCSFSLDPTSFVLGSETGGVFKCSFNHTPNSRIVHSQFSFSICFSSVIQLRRSSRILIFYQKSMILTKQTLVRMQVHSLFIRCLFSSNFKLYFNERLSSMCFRRFLSF